MVEELLHKIGPFKADHVGSFLRTEPLKEARKQHENGKLSTTSLRLIENEEIAKLVEKQKKIGFFAVTDGEFRRRFWHLDFIEALEGIRVYEKESTGFFQGKMKTLTVYTVDSKLNFPGNHPFLDDFRFLLEAAGDHTAKFTIPGPNMIFYSGVVNSDVYLENPCYDTLEDVADDIVRVYKDAIQAFYDAGCRYLQLDDTSWGALFSDDFRESIRLKGFDPDELMKQFADITIQAVEDKPEDMSITLHICRGNFKSSWLYEGDYEPIAEALFSSVNVDAFFLEFDSDRAGDFKPLRFIQNQKVVLGLITTKTAGLEDPEMIKKRIKDASEFVALDQLCLSPQCGFASTEEGNTITEVEQWKKLELVATIARDVWQ